jgi:hypothetical protein
MSRVPNLSKLSFFETTERIDTKRRFAEVEVEKNFPVLKKLDLNDAGLKGCKIGEKIVLKYRVTYHENKTNPDTLLLNVEYKREQKDVISLHRFGVGFLNDTAITSSDKCVAVEVDENRRSLKLHSLFFGMSRAMFADCNVIMSGDPTHTKKGSGGLILKLLTDICTKLDFTTITLEDVAKFTHFETMPFFAGVNMTHYLRALRSYGYYEGFGFCSQLLPECMELDQRVQHQQSIVNFHEHIFTLPIIKLEKHCCDGTLWDLEGLGPLKDSLPPCEKCEIQDQLTTELFVFEPDAAYYSMRDILNDFNSKAAKHKPKPPYNMSLDEFHDVWMETYRTATEKLPDENPTGDYDFEDFVERARAVAELLSAIKWPGDDTTYKYITGSKHMMIRPAAQGKIPIVVCEQVEYEFDVTQVE